MAVRRGMLINSDQGDSSSSLTGILIIIIDEETHHLFPSLIYFKLRAFTSPMWHTEAFDTGCSPSGLPSGFMYQFHLDASGLVEAADKARMWSQCAMQCAWRQ